MLMAYDEGPNYVFLWASPKKVAAPLNFSITAHE